ncbi:hypothetical protein KGP36_02255 [Patescibacteria group bacterium]|nr:hypothetical protein [Patescibacteria group bacterium]
MKLFRAFLSTLLLSALPAFAFADSGPVNFNPSTSINLSGCPHQITGTATYALASALTNTSSSAIDLGLVGCFAFDITSTGGTQIQVWTGPINNTYTAGSQVGMVKPGNWSMTKVARYVWFIIPPSSPSVFAAGEVTPTAVTTSIWYYLPTNWPN